jgi:hypothetical protein
MNTRYQIRYKYASWSGADNKQAAVEAVRAMGGVRRIYTADTPDGTYCYLSRYAKDADDTGERAYAVICGPQQQS